jgi:2-polyprenyl-6-methoxyphenol hydroxylase-like FAD-dependent oxidoreductase
MLLHDTFVDRAGAQAVRLGQKVIGYENHDNGVTAIVETNAGETQRIEGSLLIGADGIHSNVRAQMHPDQPPIHWGGALMWRGTTRAKPIRTGSSFVGLGTHKQRMVIYTIGPVDKDGFAEINWIAEQTLDDPNARQNTGWFSQVENDDFAHEFDGWTYDGLDVPALIRGADVAYDNPMFDRDPVSTWVDGNVALMGDAAHAMYPTGSNGASQAVIDAREIGAAMITHGVRAQALRSYDDAFCGPVSELILRNRGSGPFGLLNIVDERCGGEFDNIDEVIPADERAEFMGKYKAAAGFAIEKLNAAPRTIAQGAKVREAANA